ncbi:MAG: hypothetical protein KatS3mg101_0043 [Patescibacteria group bacterium]|nr:MAG: hypothetical protein KatS3mg101_0043 [Patescibacteria group bacterium]
MFEIQITPTIIIITDIIVLLAVASYTIFSFLLMRQIKLMNRSFSTPLKRLFTFFGRAHFFVSLILLFAAILNLR